MGREVKWGWKSPEKDENLCDKTAERSVTRSCYITTPRIYECIHIYYTCSEINEKWILGVAYVMFYFYFLLLLSYFFFEYIHMGRVTPPINRLQREYALEWRKCWMTRKIFIHSRVTTEDKFVSLWKVPLSFVLSFFTHVYIYVHIIQ